VERTVEFRALGSIDLRVNGVEAADVLAQPKRLSLFALLALGANGSLRRDTLVALLWPESDQSRARHALRQSIYYLRNHLGESLFLVRGEEIAVDRERLWCDVNELDRAWKRGDLERVAELYRGSLLEGFHASGAGNEFEFWLERERFRLQEIAGEANRLLSESARAGGDVEAAVRWATARRAAQPADEGALLALMRLLNEAGRRESALEAYRTFVAQSGYPGSEELEALALELQAEAERGWSSRMVPPPTMPGALIGRRRWVDEGLGHMESGVRLLTLTGTGGVGKTRLAIELARAAQRSFEGGVAWASLAPLRDPSRLPDAVAEAVGLEPRPAGFDEAHLMSWLSGRRLLLVLDNFEHLIEAAPFVAQLLRTCPGLSVLVTSRSPLKLRGEQELDVPPLTLPDPSRRPGQELPFDSEAVALFVDRVRALSPSFRLTDDNADAVIEICRRLEGIPLAIELAAPRTKIMSSAALARRLEKQLPLLTSGPRDLPERQRTLYDAIRWSVDLLDPAERELLFGLAVFAGGCDLSAVESVVETVARPDGDAFGLLTALIDTSLLRRTEAADGESRFTMLESIREYGTAELERGGRAEIWQAAHARHYAAWVDAGCRTHYCTPGEAGWFDRVTEEHENLVAAMQWSLDGKDVECAVRIAASVAHFWCVRGRLAEGLSWLDRILAAQDGLSHPLRMRVLAAAAHLRMHQGLWAEAIALNEQSDEAHARATVSDGLRTQLERRVGDFNFALERKYAFPATVQVLEDVTRILPDDTWLTQLELRSVRGKEGQRELTLRGESANAGRLVSLLEESRLFTQTAPRSPTTKIQPGPGEIFDVGAQLKPLPAPEKAPLDVTARPAAPPPQRPAAAAPQATAPAAPATETPATPAASVPGAMPPPGAAPALIPPAGAPVGPTGGARSSTPPASAAGGGAAAAAAARAAGPRRIAPGRPPAQTAPATSTPPPAEEAAPLELPAAEGEPSDSSEQQE